MATFTQEEYHWLSNLTPLSFRVQWHISRYHGKPGGNVNLANIRECAILRDILASLLEEGIMAPSTACRHHVACSRAQEREATEVTSPC